MYSIGQSQNAYPGNPLKRRAEEEAHSSTGKRARLEDLTATEEAATAAALKALAESDFHEMTEDQIFNEIEKSADFYVSLSFELKESIEFNQKACSRNGLCLQYMDSFYQNKYPIASAAVKNNPKAISYISPYLSKGIDLVVEVLKTDASLVAYVPKKYFETIYDLKAILEITGIDGFKNAPDNAKKNRSLILSLIQSGYKQILEDLDPVLKSDGLFFRDLLIHEELNKELLSFALSTYAQNADFMLSIIDLSTEIADLTSEHLKIDKNFIIQALQLTDVSSFVKAPLLDDKDVLEELIRYKPDVYTLFSEELQNDSSFAVTMLVKNPEVLNHLSNSVKQELKQKIFVLEFFKQLNESKPEDTEYEEPQKSPALAFLGKRWFSQLGFMLEVIDIDPQNVIYATAELKKNKELITRIAKNSPQSLPLIDQSVLKTTKFMKELIKMNPDCLDYAPLSIWDDHETLKDLLDSNPDLIAKFPDELRELKIFQ